jgi:hypothetical protein
MHLMLSIHFFLIFWTQKLILPLAKLQGANSEIVILILPLAKLQGANWGIGINKIN